MQTLTIIEDRGILKKTGPLMIIFGILATIIGVGIFSFFIRGAIGGALLGGLGAGGITLVYTGFKRLSMANKAARTIIYADETGVKFAKDAYTNADTFIPWHDIQSVNTANKNFLIMLKNPDEYCNSLNNKRDINMAKQSIKKFKTPILVSTTTCKESADEIAERVNQILQLNTNSTI